MVKENILVKGFDEQSRSPPGSQEVERTMPVFTGFLLLFLLFHPGHQPIIWFYPYSEQVSTLVNPLEKCDLLIS
jgi:hypothetical protein